MVIGKSMLFKKSVAQRFGGIKTLSCYLAEDYMAGKAMQQIGYKVVTMIDPIIQPIGNYSFGNFWNRHIRWGRIRKAQAPLAFIFEPLACSIPSALIGWAGHSLCFGKLGLIYFIVHISIWCLFDLTLYHKLSNINFSIYSIFTWAMREILHIPLWVQILCGNSISWKGKKMRLLSGGILEMESVRGQCC